MSTRLTCVFVMAFSLASLAWFPVASLQAAREADLGVDTATVISPTYLFQEPDTSSTRLAQLRDRSLLVLVSRTSSDGWLHVIEYSTGREGWVLARRVVVHYTQRPNGTKDLGSGEAGSGDNSTLDISNTADIPVYLHVASNPEIKIKPGESKNVTIAPGFSPFNVSGANVTPLFGSKYFVGGTEYTWQFYVDSSRNRGRGSEVTASERANLDVLSSYVKAHDGEVSNLRQLLEAQKSSLAQKADSLTSEKGNIDSHRSSLDETNQSSVDSFNKSVDEYNRDLTEYQQSEDQYNSQVNDYNAKLDALNAKKRQLDTLTQQVDAR